MAAGSGVQVGHRAALLLDGVKNNLDITWDDIAEESKLTGIIERGMATIDKLAGGPVDYGAEDLGRTLLMEYCRYARAGALDDWRRNYQPDILALQMTEVTSGAPQKAPTSL